MRNSIKYTAAAVIAAIIAGACDSSEALRPAKGQCATIVNSPEDAISGELVIKFRPELGDLLDKAGLATRSAAGERRFGRLGINTVDDLMEIIGGYEFERVFPVDPRTEETARQEGLHLWYIVRFDEKTDVVEAARKLSELGELSKIEYSKTLRKMTDSKPVPFSPSASSESVFNDPGLPYQWDCINTGSIPGEDLQHLVAGDDMNCAEAWKKCTGDPSVIVAVMDEGVMWSHPDLEANMWKNENEILRSTEDNDGNGFAGDVYGFNFVDNTGVISWSNVADTGHGTHVAGTISAVNNNGTGICGIAGGTGNGDGVKIMSLQIFAGDRGCTIPNEVRAVKYAADNGAVVLQCSWGYNSALADPLYYSRGFASDEEYEEYSPLEKEAFDYFIHHAGDRNGVIDGGVVVFAAGNEYAAMASYPGAYKDYICVSSLAGDFTPSTYSNYGPGVNIAAPGGDTDYHCSEKGGILSTLTPVASNGLMYGYMEGTSMACPHVSGLVALGISYATKLRKHYDSREFMNLVLNSTRELDSRLTGTKLYHFNWGNVGDICPTLVDLGKSYRYNMGTGSADALLLLENIENSGSEIVLPNVYVATGAERKINVALCFESGPFTAEISDSSVAKATVSGDYVVVEGLSEGVAKLTVKNASGKSQTSVVTVRNNASEGGWL